MAKIKKNDKAKSWQGRRGTGNSYNAGRNVKWKNHFKKITSTM